MPTIFVLATSEPHHVLAASGHEPTHIVFRRHQDLLLLVRELVALMAEVQRLLRETLAEEEKTDKILSDLAEATINAAAEQQAA